MKTYPLCQHMEPVLGGVVSAMGIDDRRQTACPQSLLQNINNLNDAFGLSQWS
ncbi:hypothetical protein IQ266_03210 [filamentous cyanobacterium LEGE 11480]|uniref:Uncharacterized protein n=1 Tax=Romeriopsis navalis LEGE 11480 TaxID=2777977 RepID=A0A928VJF7_9CYAN|nr:hypothetical protein [Romeriopsis navalis LEGE 11480]